MHKQRIGMAAMAVALAASVVGLSGCAGFGMGGLSAEQINAAVKDKSSAVACTSFVGTGGQFQVMYVNNDKTFNTGGGETAVKCGGGEVTFRDAGKAPSTTSTPTMTTTTTVPAPVTTTTVK